MKSRRTFVIKFVCSFLMLSTVCPGRELSDLVETNWINIKYTKDVSISNPELPIKNQTHTVKEGLYLSCDIKVKDPNKIIGTCESGIVTELTDKHDRKIDLTQKPPKIFTMTYQAPDYQLKYIQPPKLPQWQKRLFFFMGLSQKTPQQKHVFEIKTNRMYLDLSTRVIEKSGGQIKNLKGYFHVLSARQLEYIEVSFEPNSNWVYLTPDMQIRVCDVKSTQSISGVSYNYKIEQRWRIGKRLPFNIRVGDKLPARIVIGYQLIDKNGKTTYFSMRNNEKRDVISLSNIAPIQKIRFVVGVNVTHRRIPFEFKNIPIPVPTRNNEE